jgi:hypothetical protein
MIVEDYLKLKKLLAYLTKTINNTIFVGAKSLYMMVTLIDILHAIHTDFKSHMGGALLFRIGLISSKSSKQKLNMISSTKAEIVGITDCLLKVLLYYSTNLHVSYHCLNLPVYLHMHTCLAMP